MGKSLPLKVNPKRLEKSKQGECMEELQAFFTCMTASPASIHGQHNGQMCGYLWPCLAPCLRTADMYKTSSQRAGADFDEKCVAQRAALSECASLAVGVYAMMCATMAMNHPLNCTLPHSHCLMLFVVIQAKKPNVRSTINHHLQRLSRALKTR
jgi:hypothetical protein